MKESYPDFFNLLQNERGNISLVFTLLILVLLFTLFVIVNTMVLTTTAGDVDVLRGLEKAARSAAMQVTSDSQAAGEPRVNADVAHSVFRRQLSNNLGLDPATLNPLTGAMVSRPDYTFVVYNVNGNFVSGGAPAGKKYTFSGGTLTTQTFSPSGSSYMFGVSSGTVSPGIPGPINCTLDRPGVVASISADVNRLIGKDRITVNRWVAAKVVKIN